MKNTCWFILLLSLPCLALECNPDKDEEKKPTYYMSEEFKDYVLFPEGSWWVYRNNSGEPDTIKNIWQNIEIIDSRNLSFKYEGFQNHLYCSKRNDTLYGGGGAQFKGSNGPDVYNKGLMRAGVSQFFLTSDTGKVLRFNKEVKYLGSLDTLSIYGQDYLKIKTFKILKKKYKNQPEFIFWAKNVGIIKKVLFDSTVWKLKNYHINN